MSVRRDPGEAASGPAGEDWAIKDRFCDRGEVRREMGRDETFYAIDKARDLLGYDPQHSWGDALVDPGSGSA